MHIHTIRVSFLREKQPAQYEKAQPAVEFVGTLEEGEDHVTLARQLMRDATSVVYAGLGFDTPAKVAAALAAGQVPEGGDVVVESELTAVEAAAAAVMDLPSDVAATADAEVPAEEEAKKRRGRPKGSKNTQPKAKAGANGAAPPVDIGPDIPDDDPTPNISTNPENRVNPEDIEEDMPEDIISLNMTQADLKKYLTGLHDARKMDFPKIKQILASHGVARCEDLALEKVKDVYDQFVELAGS